MVLAWLVQFANRLFNRNLSPDEHGKQALCQNVSIALWNHKFAQYDISFSTLKVVRVTFLLSITYFFLI